MLRTRAQAGFREVPRAGRLAELDGDAAQGQGLASVDGVGLALRHERQERDGVAPVTPEERPGLELEGFEGELDRLLRQGRIVDVRPTERRAGSRFHATAERAVVLEHVGWSDRFTPTTFHWFVLAVVLVSYLLVRRITQSPFGMVLQSIRENEPRTRAIGYHVERYKMAAVMLSGLFAGLAGVLYAIQNKFAAPDFVFFVVSGEVVIFNVMGGMGTLVGPFAGAAFFLLLREWLSRLPYLSEYYLIPVGIIFIIMVIFLPQGLLGFLRRRLNA